MNVKAEIVEEKVEKEIHRYESFDGKIFNDIRQCCLYELNNRFNRIGGYYKVSNELEFCALIDDYRLYDDKGCAAVYFNGKVISDLDDHFVYKEGSVRFNKFTYDTSKITFPLYCRAEYHDGSYSIFGDFSIGIFVTTVPYEIEECEKQIKENKEFLEELMCIREEIKNDILRELRKTQ